MKYGWIILGCLFALCMPILSHADTAATPAVTPTAISLRASNTTVPEGDIVAYTAIATDSAGKRVPHVTLQSYLDGKEWCGPYVTNDFGVARFVLPMPETGAHEVKVIAGSLSSISVPIQVSPRTFNIINDPNHQIGMDLETWFGPGYAQWGHQEATPILGQYTSLDVRVLRQQTLWMNDLGMNFVQLDWSNNLNGPWPTPVAQEMRDSTNMLCDLYLKMKQHPKIVLLVGPDGGKWGTPNFMKEVDYIYSHYMQNPEYRKLFITYLGKPLLDVYMGGPTFSKPPTWKDPRFTIRYVNAWLETVHGAKYGYWSWYDRDPQVTYYKGKPEAMTAVFGYPGNIPDPASGNYESPDADGHDYGVTFRNQWSKVEQTKPRFVFICQWNEFEPPDQWDQNMSNDIEPTLHRGFGNRGDGGWGFEYYWLCKQAVFNYQMALGNIRVTRKFNNAR